MQLYPHQLTTQDFILKNRYAILELDVGLGKSATALTFIEKYRLNATIVLPKYLIPTWHGEIEKFCPGYKHIKFVPYSMLEKSEKDFEKRDMVVLDESTYIKNPMAIRTSYVMDYITAHRPAFLTLLTATPILNRIPDFYTQLYLTCLRPGAPKSANSLLHWNYYKFCNTFSNRVETPFGVKYVGVQNRELLAELIKNKIIKFTQEQVLSLPDVSRIHITASKTLGKNAQKEMWSAFSQGKVSRAKAESALLKVPTTVGKATEIIEAGNKVVIFTDHVTAAQAIANQLKVPCITGMTPQNARVDIINAFKAENMAFVATSGTSSMGLNLQFCHHMIFNDCPYQPNLITQCIGRIKRIGQTKKCFIFFINSGPMDLQINKTLESKSKDLSVISSLY